jgi:DMSO/TMAO reductase YedYZ molybdopterin-dependent catalytic subunit
VGRDVVYRAAGLISIGKTPETLGRLLDGLVHLNIMAQALRGRTRQWWATAKSVGGSCNNFVMTGVAFATLIERAQPGPDAQTAVFHCAEGYFTSLPVEALSETEAFLAYAVSGEEMSVHGYPLRLAVPGRYGYKWAKWVVRVELVAGRSLGYWERRGLPDRARVGDIW